MVLRRALFASCFILGTSALPAQAFDLPGVFSSDEKPAEQAQLQTQTAQAQFSDQRVAQLEEQVRRLTGTVEDLNFQMLQLQEQIRRQQEDLEFRIQAIEEGGSGGGSASSADRSEAPASETEMPMDAHPGEDVAGAPPAPPGPNVGLDGGTDPDFGGDLGSPPSDLGTLSTDQSGNPLGATSAPPQSNEQTASIDSATTADETFNAASASLGASDYAAAETGFRRYMDNYPDGARMAEAKLHLGEALLGQQRYADAAETFLEGSREHEGRPEAARMMLKLGSSLVAMGQNEVGCETYNTLPERYPEMDASIRQELDQATAAARC